MRQYFLCKGCGNQLSVPEPLENERVREFSRCENCGAENFWNGDSGDPNPPMELELETEETEDVEAEEKSLDWSVLEPSIPKRRSKESSALRKIVPPILGGLAAFPIATIIMWYGFGQDIGTTGPAVAAYIPWVVPEKLRNLPSGFARRDTRASLATPKRLPSVSKENKSDPFENSPVGANQTPTSERPATEAAQVPIAAGPPIRETIANLRKLQQDWSSTPKENQAAMVGQYCSEIKRLAQSSADLKGRSAVVWKKEIATLAREILAHAKIPIVIQYGALGKWPGVAPSLPNDFVATVVPIGRNNKRNENARWTLKEKWQYGTAQIPIEVMPDAWIPDAWIPDAWMPDTWTSDARPLDAATATLESRGLNCLLLGRLFTKEESGGYASDSEEGNLILRVHAIVGP